MVACDQDLSTIPEIRLRNIVGKSLRYWEPRRLVYNAVLALIVIGHALASKTQFRDWPKMDLSFVLFILAVLANVCYCAAYLVDCFAQFSTARALWLSKRKYLFITGTIFAAILTHYISYQFLAGAIWGMDSN